MKAGYDNDALERKRFAGGPYIIYFGSARSRVHECSKLRQQEFAQALSGVRWVIAFFKPLLFWGVQKV